MTGRGKSFKEVCLLNPHPHPLTSSPSLTQLLYTKRTINDCSNIVFGGQKVNLCGPTPLRFNLYVPHFPHSLQKKECLFLTLDANSTFWHIFHSIPRPLPLFLFPSFGSWTFFYFGNKPYCGFASHFLTCFSSLILSLSSCLIFAYSSYFCSGGLTFSLQMP